MKFILCVHFRPIDTIWEEELEDSFVLDVKVSGTKIMDDNVHPELKF